MNKKTIKNKKWITPEIIRIKLNPEQAVLSCCSTMGKDMVWESLYQCRTGHASSTGACHAGTIQGMSTVSS
ncbi:MAG: hypothetical protein WC214_03630 [Candidatus Omnitrophota bacterium]